MTSGSLAVLVPLTRNAMPVESIPEFTKPAARLWEAIPTETRRKLLMNVWCGKCRHETIITNFSGTLKAADLLLVGRCSECHGDVALVIESGQSARKFV